LYTEPEIDKLFVGTGFPIPTLPFVRTVKNAEDVVELNNTRGDVGEELDAVTESNATGDDVPTPTFPKLFIVNNLVFEDDAMSNISDDPGIPIISKVEVGVLLLIPVLPFFIVREVGA
jgi:hypothetical protein